MDRPILTVDMDGVLASPPFGRNIVISRRILTDQLPKQIEVISRDGAGLLHSVANLLQSVRYAGRRPLPDVADGLAAIGEWRQLVLLTGRSWRTVPVIEAWLERHDLRQYFAGIYANNTRMRSAHFKLWTARQLGAEEHVDDDGSIAHYLASNGLRRVFLRDWRLNRGLPYPPQVVVVASLMELAEHLREPSSDASPKATAR